MKAKKGVASNDELPLEKWLVAYRNPNSRRHPAGSFFVRQFYAPGYYEAYDTVLTQAEKMNFEVLWFREKRLCEPYLNSDFPDLESQCTYCNKKFNHSEPVPCVNDNCNSEFCSRECMREHLTTRHKGPI